MKDKYFNHQLYFTLFFTLAVFGEVYAQFDTVVFVRRAWHWDQSVIYLGDQNNDGYDDFVLVEQDSANGEYKKWGFVQVGCRKKYYDNGDALLFTKFI